jgi:hypothetical protein
LLKKENDALDSGLRLTLSNSGEQEKIGESLSYPRYVYMGHGSGQYQQEIGAPNNSIIEYNESYNQLILKHYPVPNYDAKQEYLIDNTSARIIVRNAVLNKPIFEGLKKIGFLWRLRHSG